MRLAGVLIALLLAGAAPAGAATVSMTTSRPCIPASNCWTVHRIVFEAAAGELNDLTVAREGTAYRFTDAGAPLTAVGECGRADDHSALCEAPPDEQAVIIARLGDGADRARAPGHASVEGGPGDDVLEGGTSTAGPATMSSPARVTTRAATATTA